LIIGVLAGVNFFETDIPLELAAKGLALKSFRLNSEDMQEITKASPASLQRDQELMLAVACQEKTTATIDPREKSYAHSQEPIDEGCQCYTCANYNLSYLHHLDTVNEMNYNILIGIHNAYAFDQTANALISSKVDLPTVASVIVN
jgi:tRNA-guanine family transglycosylase